MDVTFRKSVHEGEEISKQKEDNREFGFMWNFVYKDGYTGQQSTQSHLISIAHNFIVNYLE